jgi:hypothetical protein
VSLTSSEIIRRPVHVSGAKGLGKYSSEEQTLFIYYLIT